MVLGSLKRWIDRFCSLAFSIAMKKKKKAWAPQVSRAAFGAKQRMGASISVFRMRRLPDGLYARSG
ncbi:hypothetical protein [Variovorax sp. IB41]|uniref:hypothetical protein n=1 Tax=Variovorax sp. IB41 TaxID=2779370 RepID=UPI0018E88101|nr:hypothetical protein [Variovorax sp. IB41]MBJ2154554.1 hypothetical protein [Variovorax sp. IB41]